MLQNLNQNRFWVFAALGLALLLSGCEQKSRPAPAQARSSKVKAQGQILPSSGFIRLAATPGDIVEEIKAELNEEVAKGTELVTMRSAELRAKRIAALEAQRVAVEEERTLAQNRAERQVRIAREKLANVAERESALARKQTLIDLADGQLQASKDILVQMESISTDHLTAEFVGDLEIERQRIAVGEASLKVAQQRESLQQAKDELRYARQAAESEMRVAEELVQAAKSTAALDVITAQIATAQQEQLSSRIVAPTKATVVAINVKEGEASAQLPIIEIANLDTMVCEVEINEMDARKIQKGDRALITSRAFEDALEGFVLIPRNSMVGRSTLKPIDPMARTDFRSVTAVIQLDDSEAARAWLQLHVQVEITPSKKKTEPSPPPQESAESSSPAEESPAATDEA